jgi:transcriptional regulator with XRE-family HTH domain
MSDPHLITNPHPANIPTLTLGWRLRMAIEHAEVKVSEIAAACDVTRGTVSRWTHDEGAPPRDGFLRVIAMRCGVPYLWIKDGIFDPNDPSDLPSEKFTGIVGNGVSYLALPGDVDVPTVPPMAA